MKSFRQKISLYPFLLLATGTKVNRSGAHGSFQDAHAIKPALDRCLLFRP